MSGKPALVRKREAVNVIKAAKQQGATRVEICWGNAKAVVHLREASSRNLLRRTRKSVFDAGRHATATTATPATPSHATWARCLVCAHWQGTAHKD